MDTLTINNGSSSGANSVDGVSNNLGSTLHNFTLRRRTNKGGDQSLYLGEVCFQCAQVDFCLNIVDKVAERGFNSVEERVQLVQSGIQRGSEDCARNSNSTDGAGKGESRGDSSELHFDESGALWKRVTKLER